MSACYKNGEELSPEWSRILFPLKKREYELVYHGKEREEDILADTLAVPLQPVRTFGDNGGGWHNMLAISEFPKWRKYLILLSFLDNSSARPVQIGGVDVNICHSRIDRSPRTPAVQFAIPPPAGTILSHTDEPCGS